MLSKSPSKNNIAAQKANIHAIKCHNQCICAASSRDIRSWRRTCRIIASVPRVIAKTEADNQAVAAVVNWLIARGESARTIASVAARTMAWMKCRSDSANRPSDLDNARNTAMKPSSAAAISATIPRCSNSSKTPVSRLTAYPIVGSFSADGFSGIVRFRQSASANIQRSNLEREFFDLVTRPER